MCRSVSAKQIIKLCIQDAKVGYINIQIETCFSVNRHYNTIVEVSGSEENQICSNDDYNLLYDLVWQFLKSL